jgi:polysaccharide biosynthesis/export protein
MKNILKYNRLHIHTQARIALIIWYFLLGGCATLGNSQHQSLAPNVTLQDKSSLPDDKHVKYEEYRISPEDVLNIQIFKAKALSREVRVSADGSITMPLIGTINVAGLTPHELEQELVRRYGQRYMQHPQITVTNTKEFINQRGFSFER